MRRFTRLLFIVIFLAALALPAASILLPVGPVEIENRRLVAPELSLRRLVDPGFYFDILAYIHGANPMRALLIRAGNSVDYWLLDDSPDPGSVLRGNDDWLFRRQAIEDACPTSPEIVAKNLTGFVQLVGQDVENVVVTVVPSKYAIHPEHLTPDQLRLTECAREATDRLRVLLRESGMVGYVDSWDIFLDLKAEGTAPYFRTDSHFNYEASIPWMETLVTGLGGVWDPDTVHDLGAVEWDGDLMGLLGLEDAEKARKLVVDRGLPIRPVAEMDARARGDSFATRLYQALSGPDLPPLIEGEVLVIKDSFMDLPEPSLVQYLADATFTDWRSSAGVERFFDQASSAEAVLIEVGGEGVWSRFADSSLLEQYESLR